MRNLLSAFGIIFFGVLLSVLIVKGKPKPERKDEASLKPLRVQVIQATPIEHAAQVQTYGVVKATRPISLESEVSGKVTWVDPTFIKGGKISAGQPFIHINKTQYEARLASAAAQLTQAQEKQAEEEAKADQAKKEWHDLGSTSANNLFLRKPQLANAKAQVKAAQSALKEATYYLNQTDITLDYDAVIIEPNVSAGQFISAGKKLATLYSVGEMQVTLPLTQKQLAKLNLPWPMEGPPPTITLTTEIGDKQFNLTSRFLHAAAEIESNNQLIYWVIEITDNHAIPGLYVEAKIGGEKQTQVFKIPKNALYDQRFVMALDAQNQLVFKKITLLDQDEEGLFVKSDELTPKEWIVIDRIAEPFNGMKLEPSTNMPLAKGDKARAE